MSLRAVLPVLLLLAVATAAGPRAADAARVYRWTDRDGVRHYGDTAPAKSTAAQVVAVPVAADPSPIAGLRTVPINGGFQALADNRLAGPVEVRLRFARQRNIQAEPSLPARAVVPSRASAVVASLGVVDPAQGGDFELRMEVVPGDPRARALDVEYLLPLRGTPLRIDQGFGGSFSHHDEQNRYALDLAAPIGTQVVAARDGVVMEVEGDFGRAGLDRERYGGRANMVRLLHDDGAMSVYAHLKTDGVHVRVGQRVRAGQPIGLSGNTGFTTGPHLHFAVQVNRGMRLESIPFRMRSPQGPMRLRGD
jgi:murein DD-endopeptidase MepM/ murein hydrolase activator NlpD